MYTIEKVYTTDYTVMNTYAFIVLIIVCTIMFLNCIKCVVLCFLNLSLLACRYLFIKGTCFTVCVLFILIYNMTKQILIFINMCESDILNSQCVHVVVYCQYLQVYYVIFTQLTLYTHVLYICLLQHTILIGIINLYNIV